MQSTEIKWIQQKNFKLTTTSLIGSNIFVTGYGNVITFLDLNNGTETHHHRAIDPPNGDGVECIATHLEYNLFAYAEHTIHSRIFIYSYPDFRRISMLENIEYSKKSGKLRRILCLAFSETEHLVVLTGFPDYIIEVWNWRTGKILCQQSTELISDFQCLKCSISSSPLTVTQLTQNTGKINYWEIYVTMDIGTLLKRSVKVPYSEDDGPFDFCYALDGSIFVINSLGTIWQMYPNVQKCIEIFKQNITSIIEINATDNPENSNTEQNLLNENEDINNIDLLLENFNEINNSESLELDGYFESPKYDEDMGKLSFDDEILSVAAISLYKNGLVLSTSNGHIQYIKKLYNKWTELWSFQLNSMVILFWCFNQELLFTINSSGDLLKLIENSSNGNTGNDACTSVSVNFQMIKQYERLIKLFAIINPLGKLLITVNDSNDICVWDIESGIKISSIRMLSVTYLIAHPKYPVILLGDNFGKIYLLSIYDSKNLIVLTEFNLCECPIINLSFSNDGNVIIALDKSNDLFILKGEIGEEILIRHHVPSTHGLSFHHIINVHEDKSNKEVILTGLLNQTKYSDTIFQIKTSSNITTSKLFKSILPTQYFCIQMLDPLDSNIFLAVPRLSRIIHILKLSFTDTLQMEIIILKELSSEHDLFYVQLKMESTFFVTWGLTGIVKIWNKEQMEVIKTISVNSNNFIGSVKQLLICPFQRFLITLSDRTGLMCTKLKDNLFDQTKYNYLLEEYKMMNDIFKKQTIGFTSENKNWLDVQRAQREENDRNLNMNVREKILTDLSQLKLDLEKLINKNEHVPEDEKLPIEAFDLNPHGTEMLKERAREQHVIEEHSIKLKCESLKKSTDIILENTWNLMEIPGRNVRGIFTKLKVENYGILKEMKQNSDFKRVQLWRSAEKMVSINDNNFLPWEPKTYTELELILSKNPNFLNDNNNFSNENSLDTFCYALSGTPSHQFIVPLNLRYSQLEVVNYHQMIAENIMGHYDTMELKKYFNKHFEELMKIKENELFLVKNRNDRLRVIQDELNKLEELKNSEICHHRKIIDPTFLPDEMPTKIFKVEPNELQVKPYISPAEQLLLDKAAADAEQLRLERLADNFRERALDKMMDGVLEKRWEDEIKKTPPKPQCILSEKDEKDYTPEDLLAIYEYEQTMTHLLTERERYREMLIEEQDKLDKVLEEQILKFNLKVGDSLMEKLRVEFSIGCEDLKLLRNQLYNFQRIQYAQNEQQLRHEIIELQTEIDSLTKIMNNLEDLLITCKLKYEEISTKDRALANQFKSSFAEFAGQAVVDQAYRVFRRRPKWQMRAWQTASILQDMAKRVNLGDISITGPPLPDECFQYLQLIEQVDKFSNAPNLMDQNLWQILCKMRRVKIEIEFRVRALGALMAEAESSVNAFVREINTKKSKLIQYDKRLDELKEENNKHLTNRTVQICMKLGQIEIPITGHTTDFSNAILLNSMDIHSINSTIRKAGQKKLKAMENAAVFRRQVIYKEWEHQVLRLKIQRKKDLIKQIEKTKITKEVQMWLKWKKQGWKDDISESAIARDIKATKLTLEGICNDIIKETDHIDEQISCKERRNEMLDKQIQELNLNVSELNTMRDIAAEEIELKQKKEKMEMLVERSRLVRQVQAQHAQIIELSTLLELQRLRTFPTLDLPPNAI